MLSQKKIFKRSLALNGYPDNSTMDLKYQGIEIQNVAVKYRNGYLALNDATLKIPTGSITALVGINGAGKSTLFKAIMGFTPLYRGEIRILGLRASQALKKNLISYVPQSEEVDWSFPVLVKDVVMMGRYGHMNFLRQPSAFDQKVVYEALDKVNMTTYANRQIGELSGGQKKRVFIARSIAQESQIILLDEPFTSIDVNTEDQIIKLLKEFRSQGTIVLVSTHNLGSVPVFCDRAALIKGTILKSGRTEDVFTRTNLEEAFGGVLRHFSIGGAELHEDGDPRAVSILTDDERPFVQYGDVPIKRDLET